MYGDPYITYIEKKYIQKCEKSGNGANVLADWQSKKLLYREMTNTTVYEFMNYSMHDESHSINILESVEMILGKKRVDKLSRSDLWLLLNVAYAHDIGMVSEYKELEKLWSDGEFIKYIEMTKNSLDKDDSNAAKLYMFLDKLIKRTGGAEYNDKEFDFTFDAYDAWPLEFRKDITLLMTNFIRKKHGTLSKKFFENPEETNNYIVCDRLYRLIGVIAACHTADQKDVEDLPSQCKGFGTDRMHPQFVAMLLRLGDLLDLDNNRFDVFSLKHFGPLPEISVLNYKKHKSINHFQIDTRIVEVTAKSDDFRVCKMNQTWFEYLKNDIEYLITHWSKMAPKELKGCLLGLPKLEVLHGNYRFEDNFNKGFVLEKQKLLKLFTGNNLYSSDLDFIREYIQNAFDASKLQLYYELKQTDVQDDRDNSFYSNREIYLKNEDIDLATIKPFDLKSRAYDTFPIVIRLLPDSNNNDYFIMQIIDRGIGIDKEGLDAVTNIGAGWKRRENHKEVISEMREWLSPTGGFGIGLQSAFLVTDEVKIYTKAAFEVGYRITISKYSNEKNVLVEIDSNNLYQGTTAEFRIRYNAFDKVDIIDKYLNINIKKDDGNELDLFSLKDKMSIISDIITNYVKLTFPSSLFPIKIIVNDGSLKNKKDIIISPWLYSAINQNDFEVPSYVSCLEENDLDINRELINEFYKLADQYNYDSKFLYINLEGSTLRIWDDKAQIFYYLALPEGFELKVQANYKNVLVGDDTRIVQLENTKHPEFVETLYDVMGLPVEKCLIVSRNGFKKNIDLEQVNILLDGFTKIYAHLLLCMEKTENKIPTKTLIYSCLIEENIETKKNVLKTYPNLDSVMIECWNNEIEKNSEIITQNLSLKLFSAKGMIENDENVIWMVEIINAEETTGEYEYLCYGTDEYITFTNNKDSDNKISNNVSIRIIKDKKFYAILKKYQKTDREVFFDFNPGFVRQTLKACILYKDKKGEKLINELLKNYKQTAEKKELANEIKRLYQIKRSYQIVNIEDNDFLAPLVVNKIPFRNVIPNIYYIISPYTQDIELQYNKNTFINGIENDEGLSIRQLIEMIENESSYSKLCQWVYDNQKFSKKFTICQIREAYREMVKRDKFALTHLKRED